MNIKKNDVIVFKPQWQDKGDELHTFVAMGSPDKGRLDVQCVTFNGPFKPWQTVRLDMIATVNGQPVE